MFKLSGYKVEKIEITAWKLAHLGRGRDETLIVKSTKERGCKMAVQPQHLGSTKLIPSGSSSEDTNILLDQAQQSGDIEIV